MTESNHGDSVSPGILRVAVLLSGEGTSLENLFERIESGDLLAQIAVVISSKENTGGLERARRRDIPAIAVPRKDYSDSEAFNDAIHTELDHYNIDLVACLGFLSLFETRGKFDRRSINAHPALIPSFSGHGYYGQRVHEAVIASGVKITGATVHFIDAEYDCGPIILQESVRVLDNDTPDSLAQRVQAAERRLVPEVIELFANGRLAIDGRHVRILATH
jgi:formyltetrahydrofolate-dependent phosphoribosylglycinamide formyltransferase